MSSFLILLKFEYFLKEKWMIQLTIFFVIYMPFICIQNKFVWFPDRYSFGFNPLFLSIKLVEVALNCIYELSYKVKIKIDILLKILQFDCKTNTIAFRKLISKIWCNIPEQDFLTHLINFNGFVLKPSDFSYYRAIFVQFEGFKA